MAFKTKTHIRAIERVEKWNRRLKIADAASRKAWAAYVKHEEEREKVGERVADALLALSIVAKREQPHA